MSDKKQHVPNCNKKFIQCNAAIRIKSVLHQYNRITSAKKDQTIYDLEIQTVKLISNILGNGEYSNVKLLNDFYHIKYDHSINEDTKQFDLFYKFLFDHDNVLKCDINYCKGAQRYYRKRDEMTHPLIGTEHTQPNNTINDSYTLNLICRIHTYFIHSYDSSQLTPDEIQFIENKLNEYKEEDEDILNDKKLELLSTIINNKKRNTLARSLRLNYTKFMTTETDQSINCKELSAVLANHDIIIDEVNLKNIFDEYNYDKPQLINEKLNDILLPQILKNELRYDDQNHQQMIYPWSLKTCGGGGG
eukprot:170477_1